MKKILIIGDSNALPRENVAFEQCWPWLLSQQFPQFTFINLPQRGSTVRRLVTDGGGSNGFPVGADCLELYQPMGVILQLGIVDCAPRLFTEGGFEQRMVSKMPLTVRTAYIELVKRFRKRTCIRSRVPLEKFERTLNGYVARCRLANVRFLLAIAIIDASDALSKKSPELPIQIRAYNKAYARIAAANPFFSVVEPFDTVNQAEIYTCDGYHPNAAGNRIVADRLARVLSEEANGAAAS